ncbi:MAG: hypothetical protein QOJ11_2288 [Frankiales bacterium]|nr:hypothetical protein [Frankiales bacterium]
MAPPLSGVRVRLGLLVAVAGILVVGACPIAVADVITQPGTQGVGHMVVDDAHQHVFMTGNGDSSDVQVIDYTGTSVFQIREPGASGMALLSGTLYVASCGGTTIDEYSTTTLAKTGSITTGEAMAYPCDLAIAGGRLWFDMATNYGISEASSITIAAPNTEVHGYGPNWAVFATDPADTNTLFMAGIYGSPAYTEVWNIGTSPPTETTQQFDIQTSNEFNNVAVSADGAHAYLVQGNVRRWNMPDLTSFDEALSSRGTATSVAVSPDGTRVAVGTYTDGGGGGVDIFATGQTTPLRRVIWNTTGYPLRLQFSADGTRLFTFSDVGSVSSAQTLEITTQANLAGSQLSLTPSPDTVPPGSQTQLSGTLTMQDGGSASAKAVSVSMKRPDATVASLPAATTTADGSFQLTSPALSQLGDYRFTASYAGDATHAPSQLSTIVHVAKIVSSLTLQASPSTIPPGGQTTLSGALSYADASSAAGAQVAITGQAPDSSSLDLGSVLTGSDGSFSLPTGELDQLGAYVFTASYAGDATHTPAQQTFTVNVAQTQTSLSLTASKQAIITGQSVKLTAHMTGGSAGLSVTITKTANGVSRILAEGVLGTGLNFSVIAQPKVNTSYIVSFSGDVSHLPSQSQPRGVGVAPLITAALTGNYAKSGLYRLFRYHSSCASSGSLCPIFTIHLKPNHAGKYVYTLLQGHTSSGWRNIVAWRHPLNRLSTALFKVRYLNTRVIGQSYRLAAVFNGDRDHVGAARGFYYFKITR